MAHAPQSTGPVITSLADFDVNSGSIVERLLFNNRFVILLICIAVTLVLGFFSTTLRMNASFEKMIPTSHPYILNFQKYRDDLSGLGNSVRISVENPSGTIYDKDYLLTLQKISDEVFLMPGVDRSFMKSLWTPNTRWTSVTEDGFEAGPVIPNEYDGSPQSLAQVRTNVERSGEIGQLVAYDGRSSIIFVPLLSDNPELRKPLDYTAFNKGLEDLRERYQEQGVKIRIIGFAKVVGDLIVGLKQISMFFGAAIVITLALLYWFTRCTRSTILVIVCSQVAVVWQLGIIALLGYNIDPYSVLVPFLVFAIGVSHGAQKMNGIMQDIGRGAHKVIAARLTFRRLFLAGLTALLADTVGFAVLMIIDIPVIKDLALIASIGVAILIFTNLILLPILLSFVGVSATAAQRSLDREIQNQNIENAPGMWRFLIKFTTFKWATTAIILGVVLFGFGLVAREGLKIGDLDAGAPELRPDSRYNRDNAYITQHYGSSSDVFAVMVHTPDNECSQYDTLIKLDSLEWGLRQLEGVDTTNSLALLNRRVLVAYSEGNPQWYEVIHSRLMLNTIVAGAPRGLYNEYCNLMTLYVYLLDHKAETLSRVVSYVEDFAAKNNTDDVQFLLAAGNAGIEAATNIVVEKANHEMLLWVYASIIVLTFITFKSWQAVVSSIIPLMLTSVLCEALMVALNIGVKVATLPVVALGVGIGVDYALYVMSVVLAGMRQGKGLTDAYYSALAFTGRVVMFIGFTLAVGVLTWVFSPIKFQADMGILLAFMFVFNMFGALILVPSFAYFLLPRPKVKADGA